MAKVKVPVSGTIGKSVRVEPDATKGATIGTDLRLPDGTAPTLAGLAAALGISTAALDPNAVSITLWSLIQEIPPNVVEVEQLATNGLVVRQLDGNWVTRDLVGGAGLTVSDGDGDAGNPTLAVGAGTGIAVNADDVALSHLGLEALTDPGADRVFFWDDSAGVADWLTMGAGLAITGTTLDVSVGLDDLSDVSITSAATGETLYFAGAAWVNDATILVDPGTSVTIADDLLVGAAGAGLNLVLNYDETGAPTLDAGIEVERGTSANSAITWNETDDRWEIDVGGETALRATLNGAVQLYHDGGLCLETRQDGQINIVGQADSANPALWLQSDGGTDVGVLFYNEASNRIEFQSRVAGDTFMIRGRDAGSAFVTMAEFDPDGAVDLYYAGNSAATTTSEGLNVRQTSGSHGRISLDDPGGNRLHIYKINGSYAEFRNTQNSQESRLSGEDSGGTYIPIIRAHPDNGVIISGPAGAPTGGFKGGGTLNASAVYDDNTLLTDYVFDFFHGDLHDSYHPRLQAAVDAFDPEWMDQRRYAEFWKRERRLPGMPDGNDVLDGKYDRSLGDLIHRLLQTVELQAIHIEQLAHRV